MVIIFGGKQIANNFMELGLPWIKTMIRRSKLKKLKAGTTDAENQQMNDKDHEQSQSWRSLLPQYEKDLRLEPINR